MVTSDFSVYYDLVSALRERGLRFVTLSPSEEIPPHVGVVITTRSEAPGVRHAHVVAFTDPLETIETAQRLLSGREAFRRVLIGVDPGEHPGIAIVGDGLIVSTAHASSPEAVAAVVERALHSLPANRFTVRIGHGAPTQRDRILHAILRLGVSVELVDETSSTPGSYSTNAERDISAAKAIAFASGTLVQEVGEIRPSGGEIRDIQRKSRLASMGDVTISRGLAHQVAVGDLTLDQAIAQQRLKRRNEA